MAVDRQTLVNVLQIAVAVIAALSFTVQILSWIWKEPTGFVQKIRPIARNALVVILLFAAGYVAHILVARYVFLASSSALDKTSISLNSIPLSAWAYGGKDDPKVGQGSAVLRIKHDSDGKANYQLTYDLPSEGDGYAGLAFGFANPQDLTGYARIETTITFEDKGTLCALMLKDTANKAAYALLGETVPSGKDITSTIGGNTHKISIPLDANFNDINRQSIKEIGFGADTFFTHGSHTFIVNDVRLIRR